MNSPFILTIIVLFLSCQPVIEADTSVKFFHLNADTTHLKLGAERMRLYLPLMEGKNVGLLVNHSSRIGQSHLLDTLIALGVHVPVVFTPEHGFQGTADAGEKVASRETASYSMVSLFGEKRRPDPEDLEGLDIVLFDIQDVGARFYTYISTMHYMMEACAQKRIPFIVLDRPNPNGSYVDGPFLRPDQRSFVGLHPIPVVHGLTVGELAKMINEEGWLADNLKVQLKVIPMTGWHHQAIYDLPVRPSPNLPNARSIALYPSLCLFEGTILSVGRGTPAPFQQIGHPDFPDTTHAFVPQPLEGASEPKYKGQTCYGISFKDQPINYRFQIETLVDVYRTMGEPKNFFKPYFYKLAGDLADQIRLGHDAATIQASWQPQLEAYRKLRKQYLLYAE